jgi:hypothetical protein
MRLAVRGSALPGRNARHCSPPTAATLKNVNISALIQRQSIHGRSLSSYVHESYIQTLETGIWLAHGDNRLDAIARNQLAIGTIGLTARRIAHATNRQTPFMVSLPERICKLAEAAALCCQGSAPASPPPLTAAAFRPRLLLGSGFGEFKAGALSFHAEHYGITLQPTAIAAKAMAQLLESYPHTVRSGSRVTARSATIGKPSLFPLAFRVALLASSKVRRNFSGRVLHSVVLGLPLGALAAAPGCMKMLRIFSCRMSGVALVACSRSLRPRANYCAEGIRPAPESNSKCSANISRAPAGRLSGQRQT